MKVRIAASILALAIAIPGFAQQPDASAAVSHQVETLPDTPAGTAFGAWFAAYNSGDRAALQAYNDRYHRQTAPEDWIALRGQTGPMTIVRIEADGPNAITVLMTVPESDDLYRSRFVIDPNDPTIFTDAALSVVDRPPELAIPRLTQSEALASLQSRADGLAAEGRFSGAMLIEADGETIYRGTWGLADRATGAPVTLDTRFRLGSANKMFTAVAALQLVDQGRLALDGTVGRYLPDYPNREIADKVTIRQLLTHTGGTGEIFTDEYAARRSEVRSLADYVAMFGARGPEFEPGSREGYSNYGYVLLGYIVERVSGKSYYDYVIEHIFAPAGMTDTGSLPEEVDVPGRAAGYTWSDGRWAPNLDTLPYRGSAAGGGYSTLADLRRFAHALRAGTLLPLPLVAEATRPQVDGGWYGYGFQTQGAGRSRHFGHGGGAPGMNAELRIYPESDVIIIALSNMDPPFAQTLASYYAYRMPEEPSAASDQVDTSAP